jgi:pimeloyl-ACP methyl ester carboxylesterase
VHIGAAGLYIAKGTHLERYMAEIGPSDVEYTQSGSGALVVLVHSSVAGARQWRRLMSTLSSSFTVRAVNLFGYGQTVAWPTGESQTLGDQAKLVETIIPPEVQQVHLVGHSFGGSVAMMVALRNPGRIQKLVLLEPNPFSLLRDYGRSEAFAEAEELRNVIKSFGAKGDWIAAAERFADYWGGNGAWAATSPERRASFAEALKPNFHEWDAVMSEATSSQSWADALPRETMVVYDPGTVRPIREIVELLRQSTTWQFETITEGGHMAPLTHPDVVNPLIEQFLKAS